MKELHTADNHFFHNNIMTYCPERKKRFKDINGWNKGHGELWNSVVDKEDIVWCHGDFAFGDISGIKSQLSKLNGRKRLILGNHDKHPWDQYIEAGFESVQRYAVINIKGFGPVGLAHDPSASICIPNIPWFVGHLHQLFTCMGNCVNVGVDVRDFKPVSQEQLMEDLRITLMHMKMDPYAEKEILGKE